MPHWYGKILALAGYYCSQQIPNSNIETLQNYLMPKAVQYSAGLAMMVHDVFQSLYWPTYQHDNRRTGYTTLTSDMSASSKDQVTMNLATGESTSRDKPSIEDLEDDGIADLILTSTEGESAGSVYKIVYERSKEDDEPLVVDYTVKTKSNANLGVISQSASIGDVRGDYVKEIVVASRTKGAVYILNSGLSGITSYPVPYGTESQGTIIDSTAIADVDLDGKNEIIFSELKTESATKELQPYLYIINGEAIKEHKIELGLPNSGSLAGGSYSSSIADIQGDDYPEIIVPAVDGIYIFRHEGSSWIEHCSYPAARVTGSAVIYDIDNDDDYEIIFTTTNRTSCPAGSSCYNKLYAIDKYCSDAKSPQNLGTNAPITSPAIANMDKDTEEAEIILSTLSEPTNQYHGYLRSYSGSDLSQNWQYSIYQVRIVAPQIANFDTTDEDPEIIIGGENDGQEVIFVMDADGNQKWNYSVDGKIGSSMAIGDLDSDGMAEIAVKTIDSDIFESEGFGSLSNFMYEDESGAVFFKGMSVGAISLETYDALNKQPQLSYIEPQYVIIGDSITLEAVATDANNDTLNYSYGYPFNSSADVINEWIPQIGDHGDYTVLVSVSDGNLTDSQYISLSAFRSTTKLYNQFNDGDYNKSYLVNGATSFSEGINVSNDTKVLVAKFKLYGSSPNSTESSFENDAVVINANDIWETNQYSKYLVDKNWSTYYSAGSETEAIVEQRNLTVPENPKHMIIKLKATVYEAGNGRFGVYNYNEGVYELVTSSMPASYNFSDFYFDIYEEDVDALWTDNSTHYSMIVEDLSKFINGTAMRWYYDYINDDYASQRVYESEVRFLGEILYPEYIVIQINNINRTYPGKLTENQLIQTKFNNSLQKESFNFTNSTITRYITLPKDAEILSADFKFGRRTFTEYGQVLDDFENGNDIWDEELTEPDYGSITFISDSQDSYAHLYGWTPGTEGGISGSTASITNNNTFDLRNIDWLEVTAAASFELKAADGMIKIIAIDDQNNTQIMFQKTYSSVSSVEYYNYDKSVVKFIKDNLTHWNVYDDGVFNNDVNVTYLNLSSQWRLKLMAEGSNTSFNVYKVAYNDIDESLYPSSSFETDYKIYLNETFVYSVPSAGYHEVDLAIDLERYLYDCKLKDDNTCDIPFRFSSELNKEIIISAPRIKYRVRNVDITSELNNYSISCDGNCTAPVTFHARGGILGVNDLKVYRDVFSEENESFGDYDNVYKE